MYAYNNHTLIRLQIDYIPSKINCVHSTNAYWLDVLCAISAALLTKYECLRSEFKREINIVSHSTLLSQLHSSSHRNCPPPSFIADFSVLSCWFTYFCAPSAQSSSTLVDEFISFSSHNNGSAAAVQRSTSTLRREAAAASEPCVVSRLVGSEIYDHMAWHVFMNSCSLRS